MTHIKSIVIPDLHGDSRMLDVILTDFPNHNYIFLGDLIDRGPHSNRVMAKVRELYQQGRARIAVGNHEVMAYRGLQLGGSSAFLWDVNGGEETLTSYGDDYERVREDIHWFFTVAEEYLIGEGSLGKFMVAHAARPRVDKDDRVHGEHHYWDRPGDQMQPLPEGVLFSIHGHTPLKEVAFDETTQALYLDLGMFRTKRFAVYQADNNTVHVYYEYKKIQSLNDLILTREI